jgi:hypothetical protein
MQTSDKTETPAASTSVPGLNVECIKNLSNQKFLL